MTILDDIDFNAALEKDREEAIIKIGKRGRGYAFIWDLNARIILRSSSLELRKVSLQWRFLSFQNEIIMYLIPVLY